MTTKPTPTEILLTKIEKNGANASTIGQYLAKLLSSLWTQEENFSGKRPFGNSDWKDPIIHSLILDGHLDGILDEYGYIDEYNKSQFEALMNPVFDLLYNADYSTLALPPVPKDHHLIQVEFVSGNPKIADYYSTPMTKEEAELTLQGIKNNGDGENWIIYHKTA